MKRSMTQYTIYDLPTELILEIFFHLTYQSLITSRRVSTSWQCLSKYDSLWKHMFFISFGGTKDNATLWDESLYIQYHKITSNLRLTDTLFWGFDNHCSSLIKRLLINHRPSDFDIPYTKTSLIYLATINNLNDVVQSLIINEYCTVDENEHNNPNNPNNPTALHIACEHGYLNIVKTLIKNKANINFRSYFGFTPIHIASKYGHTNIVKYLIKKGANYNIQCDGGCTPIYIACEYGKFEVIDLLLAHNVDLNIKFKQKFEPLYVACEKNHLVVIKRLIVHGVNVNANNDGVTALYNACKHGYYKIVKILLKAGANPELYWEYSPLYAACLMGHHKIVKHLIKTATNLDKLMINNATILYIACHNGHFEVVSILLQYGADVNKYVLGEYADINIKNDEKYNPLDVACFHKHINIIKLLITYGAKISYDKNMIYWLSKLDTSIIDILHAAFPYSI